MLNKDKEKCTVIVRDAKRKLYLREAPNTYRGGVRWNENKKMALRFNGMSDAVEAVGSLPRTDELDVVYEILAEDEIKTTGEDKQFTAEIEMENASSIVHWSAKDAVEILDRAIALCGRSKERLLAVVITEKEIIV